MPATHYHYGRFPPDDELDWPGLIPLLGPTSAAIARYDGVLSAIPNPDILLAPLATQEAVLSSRIEGTQATMGEVLEFEAGRAAESPARRDDFQEVLNYRRAMWRAQGMLATLPMCQRVVREAHRELLAGVRGEGKSPGRYRLGPNWIGAPGSGIEKARFVPVSADKLPDAMGAWEKYVHQDVPDKLVQLAVLHAEFEALHPFLDGNGRLGRMLVPLLMWQMELIQQPTFYVSAYFEARREMYNEGLLAVSKEGDWTGWCRFFLQALRAQAEDNLAKAEGIIELYDKMKKRVSELTRSQYAFRALDWIFQRPIFRSTAFVQEAGIPEPTARRFLKVLCTGEILRITIPGRGRRPAFLLFPELLRIAEGRQED